MDLHVFSHQQNTYFYDVHSFSIFVRHRCLMICASNLIPFWTPLGIICNVFSRSTFEWISKYIFNWFCKNVLDKMKPQTVHHGSSRVRPPSPVFLRTCESYPGKNHKCDFKDLLNFEMSLKVFLHTCESWSCKTYKCAVTRKNKFMVDWLWILKSPRLDFGAALAYFARDYRS